jgi:hypothetical protein
MPSSKAWVEISRNLQIKGAEHKGLEEEGKLLKVGECFMRANISNQSKLLCHNILKR